MIFLKEKWCMSSLEPRIRTCYNIWHVLTLENLLFACNSHETVRLYFNRKPCWAPLVLPTGGGFGFSPSELGESLSNGVTREDVDFEKKITHFPKS